MIVKSDYRDQLLEAIKSIDTEGLSDEIEIVSTSKILEEQKIYFWIRLYLNEESDSIQIGDDIAINYLPSGEELITKFICYGKSGIEKDYDDEITNYNPDDNRKILCLMIDEKVVNFNQDIPFIRTLFKTGRYYEYQLIKRSELRFINKRNNDILEYYDCDF